MNDDELVRTVAQISHDLTELVAHVEHAWTELALHRESIEAIQRYLGTTTQPGPALAAIHRRLDALEETR